MREKRQQDHAVSETQVGGVCRIPLPSSGAILKVICAGGGSGSGTENILIGNLFPGSSSPSSFDSAKIEWEGLGWTVTNYLWVCGYSLKDLSAFSIFPPLHLQPETQVSPTLVLKRQTGNCFDYSILLCSLLIGVGYDAYCMCGYATQDVALLNQIRKTCPELEEKEEVRGDSSI